MQVYNFTREYTNKIIENNNPSIKNKELHNNDAFVPKLDHLSEK